MEVQVEARDQFFGQFLRATRRSDNVSLERRRGARIPFTALCCELVENLEDPGLIEGGPIFLHNPPGRSAHHWGFFF